MQESKFSNSGIYSKIVDIKYLISKVFEIDVASFDNNNRKAESILARQLLQCICKQVVGLNYSEIGKIQKCSHGTVINSIKKIQDRYDTDAKFREKYLLLLGECHKKFLEGKILAAEELENVNSFYKNRIKKESDVIIKKMAIAESIMARINTLMNDLSNINKDIENQVDILNKKYNADVDW